MINAPSVPSIKQANAEGMICVQLDVHLWSGRKRLKKEQLIEKNPELANLPPESLATMGSIKIADPEDLSTFLKYKRDAEKLLKINGLPLLGAIGIPEGKLEKVYTGLSDLKAKFEARSQKLYRDFDKNITEWRRKDENAEWAHLINDVPTPEYVAGRLAFHFHLARVSAPSSLDSEYNTGFNNQMSGLKKELFAEASLEARTLMEKYLMGKNLHGAVTMREKITPKTLGPLRRIGEKFKSFSFLDPAVEPLGKMVDHVLSLMPVEGPITGVLLMHVWTLAKTLSNPTTALEAAHLAMEAPSSVDAFDALLSSSDLVPDLPSQEQSNPEVVHSEATQADVNPVEEEAAPTAVTPVDAEEHVNSHCEDLIGLF